jgi:hypothetical protein
VQSVSLAVMVRDDAERLRRCIQSAKAAVDEVVVLDTGSKDATVETAKAEGAKVTKIEWPNSFAAGLNALLAQVKTEWILRLDSDEWFEQPPTEAIKTLIQDQHAFAFRLIRRDLQPTGAYEEIALVRLWRMHSALAYQGVVHENIPIPEFAKAWPGKVEKIAPIWFWHDGYGQGHLEKIRRNVALMEEELKARPGQPYYEAMLAKGYKDVGDPRWQEMMGRLIERSMGEPAPPTPVLSVVFTDVLSSLEGSEPFADALIAKALDWFPKSPSVVVAVSNLQLRRGKKKEAVDALLLLEQMALAGDYDRSMPVNPDLFGPPFWRHLDRLADQLGMWDVCKRCETHF